MNNKMHETSKAGNWTVYILECGDKSLYTGIATHLEKRIARHENGNGARYTRGRGPFKLVYTEICADRSEATKRELFIKAFTRTEKLAFIKAQS
jgi:putative endonuclease